MKFWQQAALIAALVAVSVGGVSGANAPESFKAGEFTFKPPAGWEWVPVTSAMRKAQLSFTAEGKAGKAEVVFFHFGEGDGGGVQANLDRWLGMFQEPRDKINAKTEVVTVGQHKIHYVQAEGTYLSGMPGGPKTPQPNHMLMGAIVESAQGSVFVRCTGPVELVKSGKDVFRKMMEAAVK